MQRVFVALQDGRLHAGVGPEVFEGREKLEGEDVVGAEIWLGGDDLGEFL